MKRLSIKNKGIQSFFLIQITILILLLLALIFKFSLFSTICFCLIIVLCFFTYYSLYKVCEELSRQADMEAQNTVLLQHKKMQQEHLHALKENEKIWNIVKEHVMDSYQSTSNDKLNKRELINKLIEENSILYNIEYCDNKIVDAILYNKVLLAKSKDIHPIVQVLVPEDLAISPTILMTIYSNMLDNAIEATEKLCKKDRFLNIESAIKANFLIIKVENSKSDDISVSVKNQNTSKVDTINHGLGLQILHRTCKEHHGSFTLDDLGNRILATATLHLEKERK